MALGRVGELALGLSYRCLQAVVRALDDGPQSARVERRLRRVFRLSAQLRRRALTDRIYRATGGAVLEGPFRSLRLGREASWRDGDLAPKLLGCYEQELVAALAALRDEPFDCIVNVGCADGFYAVGAARLFPGARVVAVDVAPAALGATRANAERNGVAERIETRTALDGPALVAIAGGRRSLVISDCEGFELELFSEATIRALPDATCLIECHDAPERDVASILAKRFHDSHALQVLEEGPRDPNRYPMLRDLSSLDRWLSVSEGRPGSMRWLVCTPRDGGARGR